MRGVHRWFFRPWGFLFLFGLPPVLMGSALCAQGGSPPPTLIEFIKGGDLKSAGELLRSGADPNRRDGDGMTALHYAAYQGKTDAATLLLNSKASVDVRDSLGLTPLHAAAFEGRSPVAVLLLLRGAAIDPADSAGNTPLHYAVLNGHADTVELLLATGADPSVANARGQSPAQIARAMGSPRLKALFGEPAPASGVPKKPVRTYTDEDLAAIRKTSTMVFQEGGPCVDGTRSMDLNSSGYNLNLSLPPAGSYSQTARLIRERRELESKLPSLEEKYKKFQAGEGSAGSRPDAAAGILNTLGPGYSQEYKQQWEADRRAACSEYEQVKNRLNQIDSQTPSH